MNDDLISRQAAIEALDEYFGRIGKLKRRGLNKGERAISLDVVGVIRMEPSAWIPCSERLPEEIGSYPVWTARGFGNHLSTSYWDGKEWSLRVVAWMPKPEPYDLSVPWL